MEKLKYFFGRLNSKCMRNYRIIIRKAHSNNTSNLSLWRCNLTLLELKTIIQKIVAEDKDLYFVQQFKILDDWNVNRSVYSHYIIVQDFSIYNQNQRRCSVCSGAYLHDFDNDEIMNILKSVFCNVEAKNESQQK